MNEYLPIYNRGESLTGYQSRCASGRLLRENVLSLAVRLQICREHAQQMRAALGQRFES